MQSHTHTPTLAAAGLAFAAYPQRPTADGLRLGTLARTLAALLLRPPAPTLPAAVQRALQQQQQALVAAGLGAAPWQAACAAARQQLRRHGFAAAPVGAALGLVAQAMHGSLGLQPYAQQHLAAWHMLQGRLAEMATGEGKTIATAMAAAVAALAGVPVHVLTANDYLAERDATTMAPVYAALGLQATSLLASTSAAERGPRWRHDIVHTTAREVGFDYLRDHLRLGGERDPRLLRARAASGMPLQAPLLPGLCLALVDEADSLLLDEATVPLLLARPTPMADLRPYAHALAAARGLRPDHDFSLDPTRRSATLTAAGSARAVAACIAHASSALEIPARSAREWREWTETALVALHQLQRDRDYIVSTQGAAPGVVLVDALTGRPAPGRQWSGALQPMVALKEGLPPSAPHTTAAQISYQRLFPRYLHLAGTSGTLRESRRELALSYGLVVAPVPLARPLQRQWLGTRLYTSSAGKWAAVVQQVQRRSGQGQPVLVGTDSVASASTLSGLLRRAGVAHQLLTAAHDANEAQLVARAGNAGVVTVTTNMAGRGTDIKLDAAAAAAGGLHVVVAQCNRARRIDRQLLGRSARQGDPGSAECIAALDDPLPAATWPAWVLRVACGCASAGLVPRWLARPLLALPQRRAEWHDLFLRRALRAADRQTRDDLGFAGLQE